MKKKFIIPVVLFICSSAVVSAEVLFDSPDLYLSVDGVSTVPSFELDNGPFAEFSWAMGSVPLDLVPDQPIVFAVPPYFTLLQVTDGLFSFYDSLGFAVTATTSAPAKQFAVSTLNPLFASDAPAIPETSTYGVIAGLASFSFVFLRRRRRF